MKTIRSNLKPAFVQRSVAQIYAEQADLNREAAEPAVKIQEGFEEMGV
jgi:hypothetical protein